MSRSKHTDPSSIRAARRVREPRERRGVGDLSLRRRQGKMLKETGVLAKFDETNLQKPVPVKPRVIIRRPQPGFYHPVNKIDILNMLDTIGPLAFYGLHSIELGHAPTGGARSMPAFASYHVPGKIVLYEQPVPPWRLRGDIAPATARQLEDAGAVLTRYPGAGITSVAWPGETLRRFMLDEVLLHEIGHHLLQQHKGKRSVRVARTRDHEAFAERFSKKQRAAPAKRRKQEA